MHFVGDFHELVEVREVRSWNGFGEDSIFCPANLIGMPESAMRRILVLFFDRREISESHVGVENVQKYRLDDVSKSGNFDRPTAKPSSDCLQSMRDVVAGVKNSGPDEKVVAIQVVNLLGIAPEPKVDEVKYDWKHYRQILDDHLPERLANRFGIQIVNSLYAPTLPVAPNESDMFVDKRKSAGPVLILVVGRTSPLGRPKGPPTGKLCAAGDELKMMSLTRKKTLKKEKSHLH